MNIEHKSDLFDNKLFNLIYSLTGKVLLQSEMDEIINTVNSENPINSKYDNLIVKLQSMRTYQKSYFKGNKSHLKEAMDREKVIDKIIDDYFSPQTKLF
jgi:hypothetical protein